MILMPGEESLIEAAVPVEVIVVVPEFANLMPEPKVIGPLALT